MELPQEVTKRNKDVEPLNTRKTRNGRTSSVALCRKDVIMFQNRSASRNTTKWQQQFTAQPLFIFPAFLKILPQTCILRPALHGTDLTRSRLVCNQTRATATGGREALAICGPWSG